MISKDFIHLLRIGRNLWNSELWHLRLRASSTVPYPTSMSCEREQSKFRKMVFCVCTDFIHFCLFCTVALFFSLSQANLKYIATPSSDPVLLNLTCGYADSL